MFKNIFFMFVPPVSALCSAELFFQAMSAHTSWVDVFLLLQSFNFKDNWMWDSTLHDV